MMRVLWWWPNNLAQLLAQQQWYSALTLAIFYHESVGHIVDFIHL